MAFIASKSDDLSPQEAFAYLQRECTAGSSFPPVRPKGGDIYLFSPGKNASKKGQQLHELQ